MVVLGCCHVPSAWAAPHSGRARDGSFARGVVAARSRGVASAPAVASARPVAPASLGSPPPARASSVRVRRMTPRDASRGGGADRRGGPRARPPRRSRRTRAKPPPPTRATRWRSSRVRAHAVIHPAVVGVVGVLFGSHQAPEMKLGGQGVASSPTSPSTNSREGEASAEPSCAPLSAPRVETARVASRAA